MKTETVTRTVLASGLGAVLVGVALLCVPGTVEKDPPPAPGPAARALTAVTAGSQASLPELSALIGDRRKWLRAHPGDDESWAVLGAAYTERATRAGEAVAYRRAEQALRRSVAALPVNRGNVDAQVGLGALAAARGDYVAARNWGEGVRKQRPRRWSAYPVLIDAYTGMGDLKSAQKALDRLQKLHSGTPVLIRTARMYWARGWREDAAATAAEAAARARTPQEKAMCLHRLGELAWERGEPEEAIAEYDAALRVSPDHAPSLAGRARALAALERTGEAFRDYQEAQSKLPLPEYALETGELYESLGLDGDARTQYAAMRARAAEASSHGVNEAVVLGRFEADHGDPEAAVVRLRAEWSRAHRSVEVADALAWALYRAGEPGEALDYAKRATETGVRSALFTYHRGEIERALGDDGAARRHLTEALRINPKFSPLLAPKAAESLAAVGEPPEGGPRQMRPKRSRSKREKASGEESAGIPATGGRPQSPQRQASYSP